MKKLYDLCKKYDIDMHIERAAYGDSVSFTFYNRKNHKYFCQIVTDNEMNDLCNVAFEDFLCNKVVKELGLEEQK